MHTTRNSALVTLALEKGNAFKTVIEKVGLRTKGKGDTKKFEFRIHNVPSVAEYVDVMDSFEDTLGTHPNEIIFVNYRDPKRAANKIPVVSCYTKKLDYIAS